MRAAANTRNQSLFAVATVRHRLGVTSGAAASAGRVVAVLLGWWRFLDFNSAKLITAAMDENRKPSPTTPLPCPSQPGASLASLPNLTDATERFLNSELAIFGGTVLTHQYSRAV